MTSISIGEFMNTLTGFEEIAVKQMTGVDFDDITGDRAHGIPPRYSLLTRSMTAVKMMREEPNLKLVEAWGRAQKLTRLELAGVFGDTDEDEREDEAAGETVSESGKGEPLTDGEPGSSPSSASEPA